MRTALMSALAVSALLPTPAIAQGKAYGHEPKVCLLTFKVAGLSEAQMRGIVEPLVQELVDIRTLIS